MEKFKRKRGTKAKPLELKVEWRDNSDEGSDIYFVCGDEIPRADSRMLHNYMGTHSYHYDRTVIPSFFDELEKRGYDLRTLKFSIKKKEEERRSK